MSPLSAPNEADGDPTNENPRIQGVGARCRHRRLKNYLALDCDLKPVDLGRGDQRAPEYVSLNPNRKIPTLEDDGIVLWESNAILFYMASKRPERGVWPSDLKGQADVLRWLFWESAHWDAESYGMVAYEKGSKDVLGLGPPDPAFIVRGEQNFRLSKRAAQVTAVQGPAALARWSIKGANCTPFFAPLHMELDVRCCAGLPTGNSLWAISRGRYVRLEAVTWL
jgi:hypothetical protein